MDTNKSIWGEMAMEFYSCPWRLVPNKIVRYPGGREIDRFRGIFPGRDDGRPEAWVGSDTATADAAEKGDIHDGKAHCVLPDGTQKYLFEAITDDPEHVLGEKHLALSGEQTGVLVKLLDAERQLALQCHPTRPYAKEHFGSDYGKEESWYIIGKREDATEPPYVYMGFKEGVTYADFERGFEKGDVDEMEACCHKIPVEIGDAFFIKAGLPHAIGPGCFVLEVQEPSDITVGWKRLETGSDEEKEYHKQRLLNCYIYDAADYEENLRRYRIAPKTIRSGDFGSEQLIIGQEQTEYFSFTRLDADKRAQLLRTGFLQIAIVLKGGGSLLCGNTVIPVRKGDELFFPASVGSCAVEPEEGQTLSLMLCNPPGVRYSFAEG